MRTSKSNLGNIDEQRGKSKTENAYNFKLLK